MRRKPPRPQDLDDLLARIDFNEAPLPSPCIGICRIDTRNALCAGCWRTIDEITTWGGMNEQAKREVWLAVVRRRNENRIR